MVLLYFLALFDYSKPFCLQTESSYHLWVFLFPHVYCWKNEASKSKTESASETVYSLSNIHLPFLPLLHSQPSWSPDHFGSTSLICPALSLTTTTAVVQALLSLKWTTAKSFWSSFLIPSLTLIQSVCHRSDHVVVLLGDSSLCSLYLAL